MNISSEIENNKAVLIIRFMGGLGNQIFQYNFAKYLSECFPNAKIYFDTKSDYKVLKTHGKCVIESKIFDENYHYDKQKFKIITDKTYSNALDNNSIIFSGYWQNIDWFPKEKLHYMEVLGKIKPAGKNKLYLNEILNCKESVSIHIRRGDYNENFLHGKYRHKSIFSKRC